jgi:hypothetical protein
LQLPDGLQLNIEWQTLIMKGMVRKNARGVSLMCFFSS